MSCSSSAAWHGMASLPDLSRCGRPDAAICLRLSGPRHQQTATRPGVACMADNGSLRVAKVSPRTMADPSPHLPPPTLIEPLHMLSKKTTLPTAIGDGGQMGTLPITLGADDFWQGPLMATGQSRDAAAVWRDRRSFQADAAALALCAARRWPDRARSAYRRHRTQRTGRRRVSGPGGRGAGEIPARWPQGRCADRRASWNGSAISRSMHRRSKALPSLPPSWAIFRAACRSSCPPRRSCSSRPSRG